jgi:hypothetical protein
MGALLFSIGVADNDKLTVCFALVARPPLAITLGSPGRWRRSNGS